MEAQPDVHEQVLILGLDIPINTTRSVNTSAILDDPILDDTTPVLQQYQSALLKSCKRRKVVDETLESFKNLIKNCKKERHFIPIETVKICVEKIYNTVLNIRKRWD